MGRRVIQYWRTSNAQDTDILFRKGFSPQRSLGVSEQWCIVSISAGEVNEDEEACGSITKPIVIF